ncbi:Hypothetical protein A7982_07376 [Minicystis rosea]|nr:Hypothetical protein A7982_07376 [Minicystis rosea]
MAAGLSWTTPARADVPSLFGFGARAAGLARSGVATDDVGAAARENPALAAIPGLRVRIGYGYGAPALTFNGKDAGVPRASGVDLAAQYGAHVGRGVEIGLALGLHLPDPYLAKVTFRPATEPQFPLYEAPLQRTTFDVAVAVRYGPLFVGGGVAAGLAVGGEGTRFVLAQDGHGTQADGAVDVALPYRVAPLFGVRADLGRFAFGATFRGAMGLDLRLDNDARIALSGNPLNGTTTVRVSGTAGYDPAVITIGTRAALFGGLSALASIEYAVYSAAPPPIADVTIDVRLGTTPGLRDVKFPAPRFRDTLAPRFGLELRRPSPEAWQWAVRAGYAFQPSPIPMQNGLTSYADAKRHQIALGGGYRFGRAFGVDFSAEAAAQAHLFVTRTEIKDNPALPYARFEAGGRILYGAVTLEASW